MTQSNAKETVNLTKDDLKEILQTVVIAAKQPSDLEQKKLEAEAQELRIRQETRAASSADVLAGIENKRRTQQLCSHEHSNGRTHCVFVQEQNGGGYLICQKNQCKIRPFIPVEQRLDKQAIYDTDLYNRIFQKLNLNEIFD